MIMSTNNGHNNKYVKKFITKCFLSIVLFFAIGIYTKISIANKNLVYKSIYQDSFSFSYMNNLYNKYLGGIIPFKNLFKDDSKPVFNESLHYNNQTKYKDGVSLEVSDKYLVPNKEEGIVTFVGDKEGYGKTVIIQDLNGINTWYGNMNTLSVNIYDYIEKGKLIGDTIDNKLYLVFEKDGQFLDYQTYIK